jgi:predicted DsbA family dithiol-disulfide isomerase
MTTPIAVDPGTIVVFSDFACPFAYVLLHRIRSARSRLDLDGRLVVDHHAFPIELLNRAPGTRHGSDSEIPVLGALEPDAGWQTWQGPDYYYPSTMLPAFEAVQAAKRQSLDASEALDAAIRTAFWRESRAVHLHHELLDIAATVESLDVELLCADLEAGVARSAVFEDARLAAGDAVSMSPHVFLPDGSDHPNPGVAVTWSGDWAKGFPIITRNEPEVIDTLVRAAAG